jgi:hypothetical protein
MKYNPEKHHRRSIRLQGYDYTSPRAYFITICTHQRQCLFGQIADGEMRLNAIGLLVQAHWQRLPLHFAIELDTLIVMPNHLHGVLILTDTPRRGAAFGQNISDHANAFLPNAAPLPNAELGTALGQTRSDHHQNAEPGVASGLPRSDHRDISVWPGGCGKGVASGLPRSDHRDQSLPDAAPLRVGLERGLWGRSFSISNQLRLGVLIACGDRLEHPCGSAIITSTSSATTLHCNLSGTISTTTRSLGSKISFPTIPQGGRSPVAPPTIARSGASQN